jgi:hypothetical protein
VVFSSDSHDLDEVTILFESRSRSGEKFAVSISGHDLYRFCRHFIALVDAERG